VSVPWNPAITLRCSTCDKELSVFRGTDTDTDTDFRDMRLSCNFVNVYTIVYHVQIHAHVYTRASPTDILARKSAHRTKVSGQVGEDRRACPARGELNVSLERMTRNSTRGLAVASIARDVVEMTPPRVNNAR